MKRTNVLSTRPNGARRNNELWKHLLAILLDRLLTWSLETWVWRVLGVSLLLAHKNDILKKKYANQCVCVQGWIQDFFKEGGRLNNFACVQKF